MHIHVCHYHAHNLHFRNMVTTFQQHINLQPFYLILHIGIKLSLICRVPINKLKQQFQQHETASLEINTENNKYLGLQAVPNLFLKFNLNEYSCSCLQVMRMHLYVWTSVTYLYFKEEKQSFKNGITPLYSLIFRSLKTLHADQHLRVMRLNVLRSYQPNCELAFRMSLEFSPYLPPCCLQAQSHSSQSFSPVL